MVQSLLDDILKLKIHRETRELPIYSLSLAKSGGEPGSGLVEDAAGACGPVNAESPPLAAACGAVSPGPGRISGQQGRISQLADRLSTILGRTVVDKTGLTGLKLTAGKGPVEAIVVDSAEKPTGN
jgi:uncharacterized protein (TIGR03435 family)